MGGTNGVPVIFQRGSCGGFCPSHPRCSPGVAATSRPPRCLHATRRVATGFHKETHVREHGKTFFEFRHAHFCREEPSKANLIVRRGTTQTFATQAEDLRAEKDALLAEVDRLQDEVAQWKRETAVWVERYNESQRTVARLQAAGAAAPLPAASVADAATSSVERCAPPHVTVPLSADASQQSYKSVVASRESFPRKRTAACGSSGGDNAVVSAQVPNAACNSFDNDAHSAELTPAAVSATVAPPATTALDEDSPAKRVRVHELAPLVAGTSSDCVVPPCLLPVNGPGASLPGTGLQLSCDGAGTPPYEVLDGLEEALDDDSDGDLLVENLDQVRRRSERGGGDSEREWGVPDLL